MPVKATEKELRQLQTNTMTPEEQSIVKSQQKQIARLQRKSDKQEKRIKALEAQIQPIWAHYMNNPKLRKIIWGGK